MAKVRRIDWSPDEYIGGTFGKLTVAEHGVYIIVLSLIYSNSGPIQNDVKHITRACADTHWRTVKAALAGLVAKGKLTVSPDGRWLTNGRAEIEINRAAIRMEMARRNGAQGGRPIVQDLFKTGSRPVQERPVLAKNNDLAKPGGLYHHHHYDSESSLTSISTAAARDPARIGGATGRVHAVRETTKERVAALAVIARAKLMGSGQ
jgi:uncharacterized protein YdaU (DUF1376 family)